MPPKQPKPGTLAFAEQQIAKQGHAVCVCGQLFFAPEQYAEHYAACETVKRGVGQPAGFEKDEARPRGE